MDILKNKYPRVLIRFHSHMLHNPNAAFDFHKILKRPISNINSGYTIQMDLLRQPESFKREMTSKHRYYVNKAEQEPLR